MIGGLGGLGGDALVFDAGEQRCLDAVPIQHWRGEFACFTDEGAQRRAVVVVDRGAVAVGVAAHDDFPFVGATFFRVAAMGTTLSSGVVSDSSAGSCRMSWASSRRA